MYIELNAFESKKKLRNFAKDYNDNMRDNNPDDYKSRLLKSSHIRTAEMILEFFSNFLYLQAKSQPTHSSVFKINRQALATACEYNKRTASNHIDRLLEAGVLKMKIFRGTNTGFIVEINPDILVAKQNYSYQQLLLIKYCELQKIEAVPDEILEKLSKLTPSFSVAPTGMLKNLQHIITSTLLQELNINMEEKGIVDNDNSPAGKTNNEVNNVINNDRLLQEPQGHAQEHGMQPPTSKNRADNIEQGLEKRKKIALRRASLSAYQFLEAVFYSERSISDHDIDISLMHLEKYFAAAQNEKQLTQKFNEFIQRALLVRQYILKAPGRFIPNPRIWLDPAFTNGFAGTEIWLKDIDKKREANKEYYGNLKILAKLYREFIKNPTLDNYLSGRQTLAKKKNSDYLAMYDTAIVNQVPHIAEIYNKMNQNAA